VNGHACRSCGHRHPVDGACVHPITADAARARMRDLAAATSATQARARAARLRDDARDASRAISRMLAATGAIDPAEREELEAALATIERVGMR